MDFCDVNVWLALALSKHVHHKAALLWLGQLQERRSVILCRSVQLSLLRLLTTAAVLGPYGNPPLTNREAWSVLAALRSDDRVWATCPEPARLEAHWERFGSRGTASPKLWMDAYLAAFAHAGGYRLVTTDTAFRQFEDLEVVVLS